MRNVLATEGFYIKVDQLLEKLKTITDVPTKKELLNEFESEIARILVKLNFHSNYELLSLARTLIHQRIKLESLSPRQLLPIRNSQAHAESTAGKIVYIAIETLIEDTFEALIPIIMNYIKKAKVTDDLLARENLILACQDEISKRMKKFGCEITISFFYQEFKKFLNEADADESINHIFEEAFFNYVCDQFAKQPLSKIKIETFKAESGAIHSEREYSIRWEEMYAGDSDTDWDQKLINIDDIDLQRMRKSILKFHSTEEIQAMSEKYKIAAENKDDPIFERTKEQFRAGLFELRVRALKEENLDDLVEKELQKISAFYAELTNENYENNVELNKILYFSE